MKRTDQVLRLCGITGAIAAICALASGCSAQASGDDAPGVDTETVETQQTICSANGTGNWCGTAQPPPLEVFSNYQRVHGVASFTGPAGNTRKMGVCLLQLYTPNVACNTADDCTNAPATLPSGGFRYCVAPDGVGQKYCYYRPGTNTAFCAGSPANGAVPVAPGSYSTPYLNVNQESQNGTFISYACFEGCLATDPSASSSTTTTYVTPHDYCTFKPSLCR